MGTVATSTKMRKIPELLQEIKEDQGNKKTIIFSSFVGFLDLLEPYLKRHGFRCLRCAFAPFLLVEDVECGAQIMAPCRCASRSWLMKPVLSCRSDERDAALNKLRTRDKYTVILISLKCGNVGLNLTCASRTCFLGCER